MAVIVGDQVDGETQVPEATRPADAVEIGLSVLGEVEVDHDVHRLDVDTAREQVCGRMSECAGVPEERGGKTRKTVVRTKAKRGGGGGCTESGFNVRTQILST